MDYKDRIKSSIEKFAQNDLWEMKKLTKKRDNPEQRVELECRKWFKENGFDMTIIDTGHRDVEGKHSSEYGVSDSIGNHNSIACFVEFKAKGRRSCLQANQYFFLKRKIDAGCFACVVDGSTILCEIWTKFCVSQNKKEVLLEYLPIPKEARESESLFD